MTKSLTELIAATQAQMIDDGTRFSTATCTAAIRAALAKMNKRIPLQAEEILDTLDGKLVYEPTEALYVTDVLQYFTTTETYPPLEYRTFDQDNRAFFQLKDPLPTGLLILARFTKAHTVSGLDSATDSTLTADQDQVLIDGACMQALAIRAASRIETINLQESVAQQYRESMIAFGNAFEMGIRYYERREPPPSVGRLTAWNDEYHGFPI